MKLPRYFQTDDDSGPILFFFIVATLVMLAGIVVIGAMTHPVGRFFLFA